MRAFSIVVAADDDLGIGKAGELAWRLPGDIAWFRDLTSTPPEPGQRNTVFMGRKTWESIPPKYQPLPNRLNIVITRRRDYTVKDGAIAVSSIEDALAKSDSGHIFCAGGGEIYRLALAMPNCHRVYLTRVNGRFACDTFMADPYKDYEIVDTQPSRTESGTTYDIVTMARR